MSLIDVSLGNPYLFGDIYDKYWDKSEVKFSSDSIAYQLNNVSPSKKLISQIRFFHREFGNYFPSKDEEPFIASGITQTFSALIYALYVLYGPLEIVQKAPSYPHKWFVENLRLKGVVYKYLYDDQLFVPDIHKTLIEIVTTPNNPDGANRKPITDAKYIIFDLSHDWPFFNINIKDNLETIYEAIKKNKIIFPFFSMSKSIGQAGDRVGYVWLKKNKFNEQLIKKMKEYLHNDTLGPSIAGQASCSNRIDLLTSVSMQPLFDVLKVLVLRYDQLKEILRKNHPNVICKSVRGSAYFWAHSTPNISEQWKKLYRIDTMNGETFGVDNSYLRINLMTSEKNFNILLKRLGGDIPILHNQHEYDYIFWGIFVIVLLILISL